MKTALILPAYNESAHISDMVHRALGFVDQLIVIDDCSQDATFDGNLHHIKTADFLIVNTRDKDIGTIWEAGYAYANEVPIVYFCQGLPVGAKFNLMLARSRVKVCTSFEQLEDYLDRCFEIGDLILEPYDQEIE